jgi:CHAT domain-containing protein
MNPADPLGSLNGIDKDFIAGQRLQNGRPLVFANACAHTGKLGGLVSGLGRELFSSGAQNTIGALARISQRVAIPFAQKFYAHLLGNNEPIGLALCNTKREFHTGATDPSHLFYCLYGPPGSRFEYVPAT